MSRTIMLCGGPAGDQTNSETELEGFSPSSNLICKCREKGAAGLGQGFVGDYDVVL